MVRISRGLWIPTALASKVGLITGGRSRWRHLDDAKWGPPAGFAFPRIRKQQVRGHALVKTCFPFRQGSVLRRRDRRSELGAVSKSSASPCQSADAA